MNMFFLFLYIVSGLIAPATYAASIDITTKPIICSFWGNKIGYTRPQTPITNASAIPKECEVILFCDFGMSEDSEPLSSECLDEVLQLNRPVLLEVTRDGGVEGWSKILTPDGNEKDAKALSDFVKSKGIAGVIINSITPARVDEIPDASVAKNIVPYLCQLKTNNEFIVGVLVEPINYQLVDPCVIDFEAMNPFVDLYIVNTLNTFGFCEVALFNGLSPIKSTNDGNGIDTVIEEISETKIAVDKIYMVATLLVVDPDYNTEYLSHSEVCVTKNDISQWCAPTTKDYYEKGKFFQEQNYGVIIMWPELDDVDNSCGCCPFIGLLNVVAGYKGEQQIPCAKFDIKNSVS